MFAMFPDGWPGTGLLLLRLAMGMLLISQSLAYFRDKLELGISEVAIAAIVTLLGFSLLVGFLTRFVALAASIIEVVGIFSWLPVPSVGPLVTPTTAALSAVIALAVTCLGAGAMSLDARLFGRREIVIPPSSPRE